MLLKNINIKDFYEFIKKYGFDDEFDLMITTVIDNQIRFRVDFKNIKKTYCNEFDGDTTIEDLKKILKKEWNRNI